MPAKPARGKSFMYGDFKKHVMLLSDALLGTNTTAVVICSGAGTLMFSLVLVECMAQNVLAMTSYREMRMELRMNCVL